MSRWSAVNALLLRGGALALATSCGTLLPTVKGPEDSSVLTSLHGTLLVPPGLDDRSSFDLYALPSTVPHRITLAAGTIDSSGPDADGRIAYLTRDWFESRTQLRLRSLESGKDLVIREWADVLERGCTLAISPGSAQVAVVRSNKSHEEGAVDDGLDDASVDVIDLESGEVLATKSKVYRPLIRWSSDGRRLLIAANGPFFPAASALYDATTHDLVATDRAGLRKLAPEFSAELPNNWSGGFDQPMTDVPSDERSNTPGLLLDESVPRTVIGVVDGRIALYHGLPTEGTEQKFIPFARLGPTAEWTIKASDLKTGAFCTVVPYLRSVARYVPVDVSKFFARD
jgi:hypothetical protein